jgi:hypothetical protein
MWLDNLDSHLLVVLGASKVPLAYVTQEEVALPHGADPPGNYASVQAEMIRRAPHGSAEYQLDNMTVWDIVRKSVHGTQAYTWIKTHANARNGREAYLSLKNHYLGTAANELALGKAEATVENTFCDIMTIFCL